MKHQVTLTITSLLSILFMAFHLTDDIVRGIEPGGVSTLVGVLILVIWLYGTLVHDRDTIYTRQTDRSTRGGRARLLRCGCNFCGSQATLASDPSRS
jgi:hypothetical protein